MRLVDADAILGEIYSHWGCDPAYFSASEDVTERTMAQHDMGLIEFIELLKERDTKCD